jgi:hypothetical protein
MRLSTWKSGSGGPRRRRARRSTGKDCEPQIHEDVHGHGDQQSCGSNTDSAQNQTQKRGNNNAGEPLVIMPEAEDSGRRQNQHCALESDYSLQGREKPSPENKLFTDAGADCYGREKPAFLPCNRNQIPEVGKQFFDPGRRLVSDAESGGASSTNPSPRRPRPPTRFQPLHPLRNSPPSAPSPSTTSGRSWCRSIRGAPD